MQLGTDPEFFLSYMDDRNYADFISNHFVLSPAVLIKEHGIPVLGGDNKHPVLIDKDNFKFIMDGVAMELNFKTPFKTPEEMYDSVLNAKSFLLSWATNLNLNVYTKPVINFDYKRFWSSKYQNDEIFMQGIIFGCDPDNDVFNHNVESSIVDVSKHPLRYGGGHLHFSGETLFEDYPLIAVKLLSIFIGNYFMANSPNGGMEKLRCKYYGKPGKYRIQNYPDGSSGIEYRTPSNSIFEFTKEQFIGMFKLVEKILGLDGEKVFNIINEFSTPTITAISQANNNLSNNILKELQSV